MSNRYGTIWDIPEYMVKEQIGDKIRDALYEYGIREKPVDARGESYIPDYYEPAPPNYLHRVADKKSATKEEKLKLDLTIREHIYKIATEGKVVL